MNFEVIAIAASLVGTVSSVIASYSARRKMDKKEVQLRYEDKAGDEHLIAIRDDARRELIAEFIDSLDASEHKPPPSSKRKRP